MLFQSINKIKRSSIITSLLLIALGVVMIICPGSYTMSLISGMGYAGMILAAVMVLEYLDSKKAFMNGVLLFFALAIGLLGLAVVVFRDSVLQILGWTFLHPGHRGYPAQDARRGAADFHRGHRVLHRPGDLHPPEDAQKEITLLFIKTAPLLERGGAVLLSRIYLPE